MDRSGVSGAEGKLSWFSRIASGRSRSTRLSRAVAAAEPLEARRLLTGTWTAAARTAPSSVGTMLLLSDGTVMAQQAGVTNNWYKLTPDNTGSYVNGTWTTLASNSLQRLYDATQVLPDGRVFVLGGEYTGPNGTANWNNTAEMYDPVANTWSNIATFPEGSYGDVPSAVLSDGRVICGSLSTAKTYIYNPATNVWTQAATKLYGDRSDEETWVKLSDGSILSYDIFGNAPHAQRYIPASNVWVDAGIATASLATPGGAELGPGLLLPDGRMIQFGGISSNSIYVPSSNSWVAAASTPANGSTQQGGNDSPGAMLPNGKVIVAVGDTSTSFNPPTQLFEYDPVSNTMASVATPTSLSGTQPFVTRFLMLPNGQALFSCFSSRVYVYTPDGAPSDAWRPTISNIANNGDNTFTLSGTQLNGMSEGASYGDDAQMSSNYPIVKITNATGIVRYARTYNWSSAWVQTGASTTVTTKFSLPAATAPSAYLLSVSGAGISSANNVLNIEMGAATTRSIILQADPTNSARTMVVVGSGVLGSFANSSFNKIIVSCDNAGDTVWFTGGLTTTSPIVVSGGTGDDTVLVETQAQLSSLTANLGAGNNTVGLLAGTFNVAADLGAIAPNVGILNGATVTFSASQNIGFLSSSVGTSTTFAAPVVIGTWAAIGGKATIATAASLGGAGTVTFSGAVSWTGGNMSGAAGKTVFASSSSVTVSPVGVVQVTRAVDNYGSVTVTSGALDVSTSSGVFSNLAGGTFALTGSAALGYLVLPGAFGNAGAFVKTGGNSNVTVPLANTGSFAVNSGVITSSSLSQNAGTLTLNVAAGLNVPNGLTVAGGAFVANADASGLSVSLLPGASAAFNTSQTLGALSVAAGATAALAPGGKAISATGLSLPGKLDVADGFLVLNYAGAPQSAAVATLLASGYSSGTWTGSGIVSSAAAADSSGLRSLGYAEASDLLDFSSAPTLNWHGVQVDSTSVLVRYTYAGDTDLNGLVDGADLANLNAGLHGGLSGWVNGDLDYDGSVATADLALLLAGLRGQGSPLG